MRVSRILKTEDFRKALKEGIYTIIPNSEADKASDNSLEYHYHLVEYLSPALRKSTFFVATY